MLGFFFPNWFSIECSCRWLRALVDNFLVGTIFSLACVHKPFLFVLIFNNKTLTVQIVGKLRLAVFTWRGFTLSDIYKEGTIHSLETLRDNPSINLIILNVKTHKGILHEDIEASVKSTVDYFGIARSNYRMAIVTPKDLLARTSYDLYVELLNNSLKKRFVVKQFGNVRSSLLWLVRSRPCFLIK